MGYSSWGHKESDMTERLHFHFNGSEAKVGDIWRESVFVMKRISF